MLRDAQVGRKSTVPVAALPAAMAPVGSTKARGGVQLRHLDPDAREHDPGREDMDTAHAVPCERRAHARRRAPGLPQPASGCTGRSRLLLAVSPAVNLVPGVIQASTRPRCPIRAPRYVPRAPGIRS
jgi:hypothetical protein